MNDSISFLCWDCRANKRSERQETRRDGLSGGDAYLAAGGDGAGGLAPGVVRVLAPVVLRLVRGGQDARPDVRPRAVVQRLLLAPEDVGVRVGV